MASLAALITAAIIKVAATNPAMDREDGPTADEARDAFTEALLIELGLAPTPVAAHAPVTEAKTVEVKKTPKKRAAKKAPEAEADVVAALTAAVAELTVAPAAEEPKPKKARKTKVEPKVEPVPEPVPAPVPASNAGAGAEPVAAKKKPGPKPKAKPEGPVNVDKLTPTHRKHLKAIAEELKVEPKDKEFLAYANAMSAEEWGATPLDDHIRAFLAPPAKATTFLDVEFNGKAYLIDPATRAIYAPTDDKVKQADKLGEVGKHPFERIMENVVEEDDE
jgi:hypothetical protein